MSNIQNIGSDLFQINKILKLELHNKKIGHINFVYHYTSPQGLKNILEKSPSLWFSNINFLNDSAESNYIYTLIKKHYSSLSYLDEGFKIVLQEFIHLYTHSSLYKQGNYTILPKEYYIACFSKAPDSLSLWNYYTKTQNSIGYNIEFKINSEVGNLIKYQKTNMSTIEGKVIYSKKEQLKLIQELLSRYNDYYSTNKNILADDKAMFQFKKNLIEILELYNLFFKDSAFSNEDEYRVVILRTDSKKEFRILNGIFIPYYNIEIPKESITKIRISPNENIILEQGLRKFLDENGFKNVKIESSKITLRY